MSATEFVAGADCSTQATKVLVVDAEDGQVLATGRASHKVSGSEGARETHPEIWWRALVEALAATGLAGRIRAISVAAQQHGLVVLDDQGHPLRPAMLWNDVRSAEDADRLVALLGAETWAEEIGIVPVASFTVSKWSWLRRVEPDVARRVRAVRLPHDYLTERLSGQAVSDRGDSSGTGWWSTKTEDYVETVLGLTEVDMPREALPHVLEPADRAGEIREGARRDLGLPPGALVGVGTGDNMAAALGLGVEPGVPVISLGTSGTAFSVSTRRTVDPTGTVAGFADASGNFLPLVCTLNCTLAVNAVAEWLGLDREEVASSTDVVVLPYFGGERTPNLPAAAGSITHLRYDTTRQEVLLATYQGAAASLIEGLKLLERHSSGLTPDAPVVLVGGGARGSIWPRVIAGLSGRSVLVPEAGELVALGAAVQAAAALIGAPPGKVARGWETLRGRIVEPDHPERGVLERIRRIREELEPLHTEVWEATGDQQAGKLIGHDAQIAGAGSDTVRPRSEGGRDGTDPQAGA